MPGAKEGEVTVVQIESEGYNKQKVGDEVLEMPDHVLVRSCKLDNLNLHLFLYSFIHLIDLQRLYMLSPPATACPPPPLGGGAHRGHEGRHRLPDLRGPPGARTGQDLAPPGENLSWPLVAISG